MSHGKPSLKPHEQHSTTSSERYFRICAGVLLIIALIHLGILLVQHDYPSLFWFCYHVLIVLIIGLFFRNNFLLSTAVTATFVISILWIIDILSFSISGELSIGIFTYLLGLNAIKLLNTAYHFLILPVSILAVFSMKQFHKHSWIGASALILISFLLSFFLASNNTNCVNAECNLGVLSPLNFLYNTIIPPFVINWIFMTFVVFIPTHFFFRKILIWIRKP